MSRKNEIHFFFVGLLIFGFVSLFVTGKLHQEAVTTNRQQSLTEISGNNYPKLVNLFFRWDITPAEAIDLAKWDVLIVDMEVATYSPSSLTKIKELNPNIKILAYLASQELRGDSCSLDGTLRQQLCQQIASDGWLTDGRGKQVEWWPGNPIIDVTNPAWQTALPAFLKDKIMASGYWDGVFLDNVWSEISFLNRRVAVGGKASSSLEPAVNEKWGAGMRILLQNVRDAVGAGTIIAGNGGDKYLDILNGVMYEHFPRYGWESALNQYTKIAQNKTVMLNTNNGNNGNKMNFQTMRFGLTSALLGDGYYSFDNGDQSHNDIWWYDEYDANLGSPLNNAVKLDNGVWRRNFANGVVLVNPTNQTQTIQLSHDYVKLNGAVDPSVNNGQRVTEVSLAPADGLVLVRYYPHVAEFQSLQQIGRF